MHLIARVEGLQKQPHPRPLSKERGDIVWNGEILAHIEKLQLVALPQRESGEGAAIYNLSGQRMQKMQRGINIVGGKKILVK